VSVVLYQLRFDVEEDIPRICGFSVFNTYSSDHPPITKTPSIDIVPQKFMLRQVWCVRQIYYYFSL